MKFLPNLDFRLRAAMVVILLALLAGLALYVNWRLDFLQ